MKKRFWVLILLLLIAAALPAVANAASSGTCGDNLTWTLTDSGVLTIFGTGAMNDYSSTGNYITTAPWGNEPKQVVFTGAVTSIGHHAFFGCSRLTSVTIPNSVTSIGDSAFGYCSNLTSVTIPNSVTSIGEDAFQNSGLTSVTIPSSVTSIGDWAFYCCRNLKSVKIPNSITSIEWGVFSGCSSLTSVTIPNSVTSIGYYAFSYCSSLTSVTIPNSVTSSIGHEAFRGCSSLTSVTIPNSVTGINRYAFADCSSLTSVTIPNSVTYIDEYAFRGCSSLTSVTIPNSVENIGGEAFRGCSSLMSVTIPNSEISIGENAFSGCTKLTIYCNSGSYAQAYAEANGIKYYLLDGKPVITTQPKNQTVNEGAKATFKVVASGATSYRWYYMTPSGNTWIAVSKNGTSATYSLLTEPRHDGYKYRCKVSNSAGFVYSNTVSLTVNRKPIIVTNPAAVTVTVGQTATFKVTATNATGYKWYYIKPGETTKKEVKVNGLSATYSLKTEARHNGYQYQCKVSNSAGSVWSNTVTLTVNPEKPVITTQPSNQKVNEGAKATFTVAATGATSYQWYYKKPNDTYWRAVSKNGKSATYTLTTEARHNGYKYQCKVSNSGGDIWSKTVTLTLNLKPVITQQPVSVSVTAGEKATFKVTATGASSYQWYYQKPGETVWNKVSINGGGTSATYSLTTASRHNRYKYRCTITNSVGSVDSAVVTLTVK